MCYGLVSLTALAALSPTTTDPVLYPESSGEATRLSVPSQDVFETVAQANPQLVDEYETSEQHYGWRDARPKHSNRTY